jgi:hypothetical protein
MPAFGLVTTEISAGVASVAGDPPRKITPRVRQNDASAT